MINGPPQVMSLAVDLHKDLVQVPLLLWNLPHVTRAANTDLSGKHRPEAINPVPHTLVADVDAALMKQVLDIAKRERKPDIHHDRELDDLG